MSHIAKQYGLSLSYTKTVLLRMNSGRDIYFTNGERVPTALVVKYLGGFLSSDSSNTPELSYRHRLAMAVWKALGPYFKKAKPHNG